MAALNRRQFFTVESFVFVADKEKKQKRGNELRRWMMRQNF